MLCCLRQNSLTGHSQACLCAKDTIYKKNFIGLCKVHITKSPRSLPLYLTDAKATNKQASLAKNLQRSKSIYCDKDIQEKHAIKDNFYIYLHCTSIVAVFVELPHSLLASHLYSPSWVLLICVTSNMCPLWRWPRGLIQDTVGEGTPDTWHDRVTLWPSVIFWSCVIWVTEEGTVKEKWECGRILKVASEQLVHFNNCIISFPITMCA